MQIDLKKHFVTGLIILLPLAITFAVVIFIINLFTSPFLGFFDFFLEKTVWYLPHKAFIQFFLKILLVVFLFFLTVLLGALARHIPFLNFYEYLMNKIPFIKTVFKATQQMTNAILGTSAYSFKHVVMVPFPLKGSWALGLVSSPAPSICEKSLDTALVAVFVPTTPNPTSGYLMMYKKEEVVYIDMRIEDALKYVISCGVITSDSKESAAAYFGSSKK